MWKAYCNFNSIKVQLELGLLGSLWGALLFQFHKGTIRTQKENHNKSVHNVFQFHKGTIRTLSPSVPNWVFADFNSIKVQLEQIKGRSICSFPIISIP